MRPILITVIAILSWLRASLFTVVGLMLIGVGHLSARLMASVKSDSFFERLFSALGKSFGFAALVVAILWLASGLGLWLLKNWGRTLTLVLVGCALLLGLLGLVRHPGPGHILRTVVDAAIVGYLMLPEVKRLFAAP